MNRVTTEQTGRMPPGLTLVSVPIGTARDITLRALDVLRDADVLAAEDTRSLRKLLDIHGISLRDRPMVAYHDHNGDRARTRLMQALEEGLSVAYASEAGTPLIADPGYDLALAAREADLAQAKAQLALAQVEFDRRSTLVAREAVAESELDVARANLQVAEAQGAY